jgi:glycosyltransferase involved in cell wall biosynthesis
LYKNIAPFGISVIICTHNRVKRLVPTLDVLEHQNTPPGLAWEILVIDNGSTDDTFKVADEFRKKLKKNIEFRIIYEPVLGKSNALVRGYNEANYELMLVCDDDNWLQPEYLKTVAEIFKGNPEIGLLGGYGIADFGEEKKPEWFDKWQHNYACGKHHERSGFLAHGDVSIWGAGSVLRKTQWDFLQKNGFHFINNTGPGSMMGEDLELAHAVLYSGSKLYFDERLWFYHDLSEGRLTWKNHTKHVKNSGSALFVIYDIAYKNSPEAKQWFCFLFIRMILILITKLAFHSLKKHNGVMRTYLYNQLYELVKHRKKHIQSYYKIFPWISKIKDTFPLKREIL